MRHTRESARRRARNLGLAAVAGQSGCATLIIVFTALFIGLWLDTQFGLRGPLTFLTLVISIPISLYVMLRISYAAISRIDPPTVEPREPEELEEPTDKAS
jgi:hypothetical protein